MKLKFMKLHKSIQSLPDADVPNFAVITGPNGSGKTHLLEAISLGAISVDSIGNRPRPLKIFNWDNLVLKGTTLSDPHKFFGDKTTLFKRVESVRRQQAESFKNELLSKKVPEELADLRQASSVSETQYQELTNAAGSSLGYADYLKLLDGIRTRIKVQLATPPNKPPNKEQQLVSSLEQYAGVDILSVDEDGFTTAFALLAGGVDAFALNVSEIVSSYNYKYRMNEMAIWLSETTGEKKSFVAKDEFRRRYGPPPWELLNKVFEELRLEYRISEPPHDPVAKYQASLLATKGAVGINFQDLSSGEKILMSLALTLYRMRGSQKQAQIPDLLLLDEIDAPLHPSMTQQMLYVVEQILSREQGVKVILTTHSPSTVALCEEESLFRLIKEPRALVKCTKEEAIQDLSSGLIAVTDNTRFVIVEGKDKVVYNEIFEACVRKGYVKSIPPLAFIEAIDRKSGQGGDKGQITSWAKRLSEAGMANVFGLIDKDDSNESSEKVRVLGRYSIENYLLDPLLIYATLLGRSEHKALHNKSFVRDEASALLECSEPELQEIATAVCQRMEAFDPELATYTGSFVAEYADGKAVRLPTWYKKVKGHRIEGVVTAVIEKLGLKSISRPKFEPTVKALTTKIPELVPTDLINLMKAIQSA